METSCFTLENGLRVIVDVDRAVPVAALGICARAGVADEPPDRRGIAHLFEHMMFRGSERFGPKEHTAQIARLGGNANAATSFDYTFYYQTMPSEGLEKAFELEADRFAHLRLREEGLQLERKVVLEELRVYDNQPMARAFRRLLAHIGGSHPYALDPLGQREDLEAATLSDLVDFREKLYRPDNCFAIVCGDVALDEVEALARRHFSTWARPDSLKPASPVQRYCIATGKRKYRVPLEVPLAVRVHSLPPSAQVDHTAVRILEALLAEGQSAPLIETLVKRKRMCVYAGGEQLRLVHGGALFFLGAFLPPGRHEPRLRIMRQISEELAARGPQPTALERVLKCFRKELSKARYSCTARMQGLMAAELLEGSYECYTSSLEDLSAVTPARVRMAAEDLFSPANTLELELLPERMPWYMPLAGLAMKVLRR